MKIQWILIAILLVVSVASEAQGVNEAAQIPVATGVEANHYKEKLQFKAMKSDAGRTASLKVLPLHETCSKSFTSAKNFCITSLNSGMQKTIATVGIAVGAAAAIATMNSSCSKFAEVLKIAQLGLTAYNTMCGVGQQGCQSTCATLDQTYNAELKTLETALSAATALAATVPPTPASEKAKLEIPLIQADITYLSTVQVQSKQTIAVCEGYKLNLAAAATGLGTIISSSALAGQCKKETAAVDCVADPMNPTCTKALDCSLAANVSNATCICLKAPNTAGCAGYTGGNGNQVQSLDDSNTEALDPGNLDIQSPNLGADAVAGGSSGSVGGNGVAPTGGGGGGGGLSGGTDGGKGSQKAQTKGLNANILSGFDGGGGGGSRGSYSSGSSDSGLQAYLPKGAKDPARNPAMQLFGNGQVTGAGSKSNFEKVSERYGDAKSTLIAP